ncbi:MAG: hypothetical protein HOP08_18965 [Cyclobacteriaceae bacterium]|nr:hypothetical protein [Cyclobacteriaceae bacterium]
MIRNAVSSTIKSKSSLGEQFANTRKAVAEEKARVRNSFAMQVVAFQDKDQVTRYVHYHQSCLITFIDELYLLATQEAPKKNVLNVALRSEAFFFCDQVEGILDFIQVEFKSFFNVEAKVPELKRSVFVKRFSREASRLEEFVLVNQINPVLAGILTSTSRAFLSAMRITYRLMSYVEDLVAQVLNLKEDATFKEPNAAIQAILLSLNFNSPEYFRYYTAHIQTDFEPDAAATLAFYFKQVNQSRQQPGVAYDINSPSIREDLSNWLREEILFIQNKLPARARQIEEPTAEKDDFKVELDMSVSQFALFTKAFVESGVIQNKNVSELIRFLSKFVKTKRSGTISPESLRIKYYDVESSTKDAVKNLLHTAIGYINSN